MKTGKGQKRMNIWRYLALAALLTVLLPQHVSADLVYEPADSFYDRHRPECRSHKRTYQANAPDGELIVYKSPKSGKVIRRLEDGDWVRITHVYTDEDGIEWGLTEEYGGVTGWVPMDYICVLYDEEYFASQNRDKLYQKEGKLKLLEGDSFYYWSYPGAKSPYEGVLYAPDDYPAYFTVFDDECGHTWGRVGFYYGIRDVWVCLDAPTADYEALYGDNPPLREVSAEDMAKSSAVIVPAGAGLADVVQTEDSGSIVLVCALVCGVVAVTAVLLVVLWKKGSKEP